MPLEPNYWKVANPTTLPAGPTNCVAFSRDGLAVVVGGNTAPRAIAYAITNAGFGTQYSAPSTQITGNGNGVDFNAAGDTVAFAHAGAPGITVYPWSSGSGFGAKYANPATSPAGTPSGVSFSPDGTVVAVSSSTSPFVFAYPWSPGFGVRYANPASLLVTGATDIAFSPDGAYVAVTHAISPFVTVYNWDNVTGWGSKVSNPATLPASTGNHVNWSADGTVIAVAHTSSPFLSVYAWSGGFGTKYADPATLPHNNGLGVAFSHSGRLIGVTNSNVPGTTNFSMYHWDNSTGFGERLIDPFNHLAVPVTTPGDIAFRPVDTDDIFIIAHNNASLIGGYRKLYIHKGGGL